MIIVSQDKETIINFENITRISIVPPAEEGYKCAIAINGCLDLGYYKTEERAKEVLKEIVQCYANTEQHKSISNTASADFLNDLLKNAIIYAMPEK